MSPLPRYEADLVAAQRWAVQPNDIIAKSKTAAAYLGGGWCITLEAELPLTPGGGAHVVADFVDEPIARRIVALHNDSYEHETLIARFEGGQA